MPSEPQSFKNHARTIPGYHYFGFGMLVVNLGWWVYRCIVAFSGDAVVLLLLAFTLIVMFVYGRVFALTVQDRVIRLEMKLRMRELLPPELARRFDEFTVKQLVALRFASDAELPALAAMVLNDRIEDQKRIKQLVKDWRADHLRA